MRKLTGFCEWVEAEDGLEESPGGFYFWGFDFVPLSGLTVEIGDKASEDGDREVNELEAYLDFAGGIISAASIPF